MANRARQSNRLNTQGQNAYNKSRKKAKNGWRWAPMPKGWKIFAKRRLLNEIKETSNND